MKDISKVFFTEWAVCGSSLYNRAAWGRTEHYNGGRKIDFPMLLVRIWRPMHRNEVDDIDVIGTVSAASISDDKIFPCHDIKLVRNDNVRVHEFVGPQAGVPIQYVGQIPKRLVNKFLSMNGSRQKGGVTSVESFMTDYIGVFDDMRSVRKALRDVYRDL